MRFSYKVSLQWLFFPVSDSGSYWDVFLWSSIIYKVQQNVGATIFCTVKLFFQEQFLTLTQDMVFHRHSTLSENETS